MNTGDFQACFLPVPRAFLFAGQVPLCVRQAALAAAQTVLPGETLWFRMVAGGPAPRYVRFRPLASVSAILESASDAALPESLGSSIAKTTIEILNLRPTMSYGLTPGHP